MDSRRDSPLWGQLMPSTLRLSDRKENCDIRVTKPRENIDVGLQACVPKNFMLTRLPGEGVDQPAEKSDPAWMGHISTADHPAATEQPQQPLQKPQQKLPRRLTTPAPVEHDKKTQEVKKKQPQEQPVAASRHSHRLAGRRVEGVVKKKVPWKMASPPRKKPRNVEKKKESSLPCASPNTEMCLSAASVLLSLATNIPAAPSARLEKLLDEMHHKARAHMEHKDKVEKYGNKYGERDGVFYHPPSLLIGAPTEHTLPFAVISPPLEDQNHRQVVPAVAIHGEGLNSPWARRREMLNVHNSTPPMGYNLSSIVPYNEVSSLSMLLPVEHEISAAVVCAPPSAGHPFGSSRRKRSQSPATSPVGGEGSVEKRIKGHIGSATGPSLLLAANDLLNKEAAQGGVAQGTPSPSNAAQVETAAAPSPLVDGGFMQFSNVSEALVGSDLVRRWLSLQMERVNHQMDKNPEDNKATTINSGLLSGVSPSRLQIAAGATAFPAKTYDEMLPVLRQCATMRDVQMLVRGLQMSGGLEQLVLAGNTHVMLTQRDKEVSVGGGVGGGGGEAKIGSGGLELEAAAA